MLKQEFPEQVSQMLQLTEGPLPQFAAQ